MIASCSIHIAGTMTKRLRLRRGRRLVGACSWPRAKRLGSKSVSTPAIWPSRDRSRSRLDLVEQPGDLGPHPCATLVHVAMRKPDQLGLCAQLKPVEHDPRRLGHGLLYGGHVMIETVERSTNQHRIM